MAKNAGKNPSKKTIAALSVILAVVVILFAAVLILSKWQYKVYGGMTAELKDSELYNDMRSGQTICFMGDSITSGYANGGIPWCLPLSPYIKGEVKALADGGWTISDLVKRSSQIPEADVYVIAIGINDVLGEEMEKAADTAEIFIDGCDQLTVAVTAISPNAKIYFIAPWSFVGASQYFYDRNDIFHSSLKEWCDSKGYIFIDPEPYIFEVFETEDSTDFLLDGYHPNGGKGVGLYSYAVLKAAHNL